MALRLRRDVQKASYYVWFLGAEEAKGLRGNRVINSVLPYLIDRSRSQEPIKVTLQVSHKGIKIIQGSSKHFIPHSAITSSVQTDDIVACVLLLYNPITKCPLHVHAYRCDSETTAEALNQQLQILINRPENQKRFEELESRLGIIPGMPAAKNSSHDDLLHNNKKESAQHHSQQQHSRSRHEAPPKRLLSSMGSDTGNSTRESEGSDDINGNSPMSRSPSGIKPPLPLPAQNNELFDSLAAELRAKLNGNGPPLLLPPRDYDTVHRSKGNLAAIELRRCRNSLIVGSDRPAASPNISAGSNVGGGGKQVSSRGSSGIGSDLAPSPERQDINSSSDDDHWSNEADNSVIALKPSQIAMERSAPISQHHVNLSRKNAVHPRDDGYLRDLPAKPYTPRSAAATKPEKVPIIERDVNRSKTPASNSWCREDEIKPIIVRPTNYDSKINRVLQSEQQFAHEDKGRSKLHEDRKNAYLNHVESAEQRFKSKSSKNLDDYIDDADGPLPLGHSSYHRKENLTDKQKYIEYSSKSKPLPTKSYAHEEVQRYGGKHRYVDPADLPFEQNTSSSGKYGNSYHRESNSPEHSELSHRTAERPGARTHERRETERLRHRSHERDPEPEHHSSRGDREHLSRSKERNPYREPESIPYIESMEKLMKSTAMRYKSYDNSADINVPRSKEPLQSKLSQRSKTHSHHDEDPDFSYNNGYPAHGHRSAVRAEYESSSNKDRFKDAKDKFRSMERSGRSGYDMPDEKEPLEYKSRQRGPSTTPEHTTRPYDDWSDEEHVYDSPPPEFRSRSRSRDQWLDHGRSKAAPQQVLPHLEVGGRGGHMRGDTRNRDPSSKRGESRNRLDSGEYRDDIPPPSSRYRDEMPPQSARYREERIRDHSREYSSRRDYTPERGHQQRIESSHYPAPANGKVSPPGSGLGMPTSAAQHGGKGSSSVGGGGGGISSMAKGYRHSYAEPVFSRSAGRVGLAAVNPY
ncbi:uncharacterized protein LOC133326373 [Musca vetustissima]|uniref:uncharacterized protein LOC133326373 n=1 Tax=Musca vetustissima TaxID=27455 RepID=UPI002AB7E4C0|nr:uncharacterized protein LOC133326373 [Musca vetustissima]